MSDAATTGHHRYGAGIGASLVAEAAFILGMMLILAAMGKDALAVVRLPAVMVVGPDAMLPQGWELLDVVLGGTMHVGMSILVGILYAVLVPRSGVSALAAGLMTGAALYVVGFLVLPSLFPGWLAPFRMSPVMHLVQIVMHAIYGIVFGRLYRLWGGGH